MKFMIYFKIIKILTKYEKQKMRIKNEINRKFKKLYQETMRMFGDKNEVDKDEEFIENLRECLFGRKSLNVLILY